MKSEAGRLGAWAVLVILLGLGGAAVWYFVLDEQPVSAPARPQQPSENTKNAVSGQGTQADRRQPPVRLLQIPAGPNGDAISAIRPTRYKKGLFWKLERPGARPSYLLGTAHSGDRRVLRVIPRIRKQLDAAEVLCTELKLDFFTMFSITKVMLYTGGKTLKSEIGDRLYAQVLAVAKKRGMSSAQLNRFKPWAVTMTFSLPEKERHGIGLDMKLYAEAARQRKKLCGLEEVQEQISVFANMPLADQIRLLQLTIDHYDMIQQQTDALIQHYSNGDLASMAKLMTESPLTKDDRITNDFVFSLVVRRNYVMANRMQPYLRKGNAFIAIGALHLPGRQGVLRLLESMGYKVTRIF